MLLWVNNHYGDFERDADMENYLETFEKGLEQQVGRGNVACLKESSFLCVTADSRYSFTCSQSNRSTFFSHILTNLFEFVAMSLQCNYVKRFHGDRLACLHCQS